MAKRTKRFRWMRRLKHYLLGARLKERKLRHGARRHVGFRIVRIERALYDRKLHRVVRIVARLFGGDERLHRGFNGPRVVLEPEEYAQPSVTQGIVVNGNEFVPVDKFARNLFLHKDKISMNTPLPPLAIVQRWAKLPGPQVQRLAQLLARQPDLAKPCGLPHEPRWVLRCPDTARIEVALFELRDPLTRKVSGSEAQIITYTPAGTSRALGGENLPQPELAASLAGLLAAHGPTGPTGRAAVPKPNAQTVPLPTEAGKKLRQAMAKAIPPKPAPKAPGAPAEIEDLFGLDA